MARLSNMGKLSVMDGQTKFDVHEAFIANKAVLHIFNVHLLRGNPDRALSGPRKVMLAESLAKRYFGDKMPVGKTIKMTGIWDEQFQDYEVSGIFRDFPENAHLHPKMLVSVTDGSVYDDAWTYNYLLLSNNVTAKDILDQFGGFATENIPEDERATITPHLQKLTDIHLYSHKEREIEKNGDARTVLFFGMVGIAVLILAFINYINLSLALLIRRKRTLAISKVFGARLSHIFLDFFTQSILLILGASAISFGMFLFLTPELSGFVPSAYFNSHFDIILPGLFIVCIAGALIVSLPQLVVIARSFSNPTFSPQTIGLMNMLRSRRAGSRRSLVVVQFTVSIALISCAVYFARQKNYVMDHRLGAGDDPVLLLGNLNWHVKDGYFEFKDQALRNPYIHEVTGTMQAPSEEFLDAMHFEMSGYSQGNTPMSLYVSPVDANFFVFYHLPVLAGKGFSGYSPEHPTEEYVLNETAVKYLGFNNPAEVIGRRFKPEFDVPNLFKGGTIVGVVKDFCFSTMKDEIQPFVFFPKPIWYWNFLVKVDRGHIPESLRYLSTVWSKVYPDYTFDYKFMDDTYDKAYHQEITLAQLSNYLMILAIVISALGLYGLTAVTVEQRTREIGIRKVIGASSADILLLLNRNFTRWVLLSACLAVPLSGYVLHRWNENYVYHAPLSWWIFAGAGAIGLLISWFTNAFRTIHAAGKNPVDVLRED